MLPSPTHSNAKPLPRLNALLAWAALLLLAATAPLRAQTVRSAVRPSATDVRINTFDSDHSLFYNAGVAPRHQLLVFLPGTLGKTRGVNQFCTTAADLGYHVINLMYPDSVSASVCRDDANPASFGAFRRAVVEGGASAHLTITRANSIENRLLKLLVYLQATRPGEGWGQFLAPGPALAWERLALAGQSQGGGHAAWLAGQHRVARVLLFSSPKDWSRAAGRPATWYAPSQTPAARYFAFVHRQDQQACTFMQQLAILHILRLGPPRSVDGAAPPFGQAHALVTNYPSTPVTSLQAHATEVTDSGTPRAADGTPLFKPVWVYMLTAE